MLLRALLAAVVVAVPAVAAELEGVTAPESVTVEGKTLALNGMGLRRKFIVNVYVGSLYLEQASQDPKQILARDGVRRMELRMLRDLDAKTIVEAINTGFEKNSAAQLPALKERLEKFNAKIVSVKKGASFIIQYVPGKGTRVEGIPDAYVAEGKDFADALFAVWLGASPADEGLKKGLLGKK
jgi:predicted enzyme involved in methoxymalonyl-ACP biosynthesis